MGRGKKKHCKISWSLPDVYFLSRHKFQRAMHITKLRQPILNWRTSVSLEWGHDGTKWWFFMCEWITIKLRECLTMCYRCLQEDEYHPNPSVGSAASFQLNQNKDDFNNWNGGKMAAITQVCPFLKLFLPGWNVLWNLGVRSLSLPSRLPKTRPMDWD